MNRDHRAGVDRGGWTGGRKGGKEGRSTNRKSYNLSQWFGNNAIFNIYKNKIDGITSNHAESIQITPRDYQKLEFCGNSKLFNFEETHQIRRGLMRSTPNDLIYYLPRGVKVENGVK